MFLATSREGEWSRYSIAHQDKIHNRHETLIHPPPIIFTDKSLRSRRLALKDKTLQLRITSTFYTWIPLIENSLPVCSCIDSGMQIWAHLLRRDELLCFRKNSPWNCRSGYNRAGGEEVAGETQAAVSFTTTHSSSADLKVLAGHGLLAGPGEDIQFPG